MNPLARARSLVRGMRWLGTHPVRLAAASSTLAGDVATRPERFLRSLDELVWPFASSPTRRLLDHAGIQAGDVRARVEEVGLEPTLEWLRDEGVYVAYDEWLGRRPAVRGSAVLQLGPADFANPRVPPDLYTSTGGTRSGGTAVTMSFENVRRGAELELVSLAAWGVDRAPIAVWMPVLPSATALNHVLRRIAEGRAPERWFSPIDPNVRPVAIDKRLANLMLPVAVRLAGARVPRPEKVAVNNPDPVLDWCQDALQRAGAAVLGVYPSTAVTLCRRALERGVRLDGLVVMTVGEPVSHAKLAAVHAAGARLINRYAFMQFGAAGVSCPESEHEQLHVWDSDVAVIQRDVARADGRSVRAFLWTSLDPKTRSVLVNVENDDFGEVEHAGPACGCLLGDLGMRTRIARIRGISKVVAGGVTVPGEVFEQLAEVDLPARFGGGPGDYQFAEVERDGVSGLALRVDPRLGAVDTAALVASIRERLGDTDTGVLADEMWEQLRHLDVRREPARRARSGKVLAIDRSSGPPGQSG